MRTTAHVVISLSVALILAILSTAIRMSVMTAKAEESGALVAETDSSIALASTFQGAPFIWVESPEIGNYPGYRLVEGGKHSDGTMMYICRVGGTTPGKLYKNLCHFPMAGGETVVGRYQVLLTNRAYQWLKMRDISRVQIKSEAVKGGVDEGNQKRPPLYICRKKMSDGVHPGKYSFSNNLCYIAWGDKERFYTDGFDILFP